MQPVAVPERRQLEVEAGEIERRWLEAVEPLDLWKDPHHLAAERPDIGADVEQA